MILSILLITVYYLSASYLNSYILEDVDPDWVIPYNSANLFYAVNSIRNNSILKPHLSNGFIGHEQYADNIYVAGIFNGKALYKQGRAAIPYYEFIIADLDVANFRYAINIEQAVFYERFTLNKVINVEERFYTHLSFPNLMVHEIHLVNTFNIDITVNIGSFGNNTSSDFNFEILNHPDSPLNTLTINGNTLLAESDMYPLINVTKIITVPKSSYIVQAGSSLLIPILTVICTSVQSNDTILDAYNLYNTYFSAFNTLFDSHVNAWKSRWSQGRIEINGNFGLAQAVNSSLYSVLSAIRSDINFGIL